MNKLSKAILRQRYRKARRVLAGYDNVDCGNAILRYVFPDAAKALDELDAIEGEVRAAMQAEAALKGAAK